MDGFWVQMLVALIAGACGAAATMGVLGRGFRRRTEEGSGPPTPDLPIAAHATCRPDRWLSQMHRCEQAVCRAARAVDSVSSAQARHGLCSVVRRMDAELPNVRALVELGRGLEERGGGSNAVRRVYQQLDDAAARFVLITDHVLNTLAELVAEPDLDRAQRRVTALREQFPLLRPMSALLGPGAATPRSLIDVSV